MAWPPRDQERSSLQDRYSSAATTVVVSRPATIANPGLQVGVIGTALANPITIQVMPTTAPVEVDLTEALGLSYSETTKQITGTPSGTPGNKTITITSGSQSTQFDIQYLSAGSTVEGHNFPPVVTNPGLKAYTAAADFANFGITVTDEDKEVTPTVTVTGLDNANTGLTYDAAAGEIRGPITTGYIGVLLVRISATDGTNTAFTEFFISVGTTEELASAGPGYNLSATPPQLLFGISGTGRFATTNLLTRFIRAGSQFSVDLLGMGGGTTRRLLHTRNPSNHTTIPSAANLTIGISDVPEGLDVTLSGTTLSGTMPSTTQKFRLTIADSVSGITVFVDLVFYVFSGFVRLLAPISMTSAFGGTVFLTDIQSGGILYRATGLSVSPAGIPIASNSTTINYDASSIQVGTVYTISGTYQGLTVSASAVKVSSGAGPARGVVGVSAPSSRWLRRNVAFQDSAASYPAGATVNGLPEGVTVDANGVLSGEPVNTANLGQYITSFVSNTRTSRSTIHLVPEDARVGDHIPGITTPGAPAYRQGDTITPLRCESLTDTGGRNPLVVVGLPQGLTYRNTTGMITGTVSLNANPQIYPCTAFTLGANGVFVSRFTIGVYGTSREVRSIVSVPVIQSPGTKTYVPGEIIEPFKLQVIASNPAAVVLNISGIEALGLTFNRATATVSGTINTDQVLDDYTATITAESGGGVDTDQFTIRIVDDDASLTRLPQQVVTVRQADGGAERLISGFPGLTASHTVTSSNSAVLAEPVIRLADGAQTIFASPKSTGRAEVRAVLGTATTEKTVRVVPGNAVDRYTVAVGATVAIPRTATSRDLDTGIATYDAANDRVTGVAVGETFLLYGTPVVTSIPGSDQTTTTYGALIAVTSA